MATKRLVPVPVLAAATAPTAGNTGDLYLNTTNNTLYVWNGSVWSSVSSGGAADGASIAPYANFDGGSVYDVELFPADITQVITDTFDLGTP